MQTTLVLTQPNLDEALARARRFVATRTALRALACVHLKAEDGRLQIEATNLEIGVRLAVPARVEQPGAALCAPAIALADLVKTLPPDQITLRLDAETGAGALRLWDMLTEKYGVHSNTIRWAATEEEEAFVVVQVSLHPKCVLKTATTWPAALVLAAHAALQAGWLEEKGNDVE